MNYGLLDLWILIFKVLNFPCFGKRFILNAALVGIPIFIYLISVIFPRDVIASKRHTVQGPLTLVLLPGATTRAARRYTRSVSLTVFAPKTDPNLT